ncbi:MAG: electron transfer flavoprotein subunit beta/FixA family protein [Chloroflexi bacterium]|nr:electron transfer flavoprotein subunit beta/FixA family protein [Chloroflexota bacterium]MBM3173105.1 electron transfer flavoprotein subunit beta/FixA family protein [Chloroflexota bacterium]MBM3175428.1 electron transfer flavoprotein subunit beta/FixA family protein [Chloroflexota bacterium]MBM4449874.1 electron transfer flavoprotein subunit beta/FixA family protein [Chloroflexota bacterium]
MPVNMIVCCKQVIDPEAPPASFKIDPASNQVIPPPGVPPVISPFDEQAVEAALRIKDSQGGKITVLSLGNNLLRDVVKKPLSMGADELILLEDPAFEGGDSWSTAYALTMAIKKIGQFDLIFCGRQAADWDAGQIGSGIAELLGIPSVTVAKKVEVADGKAKVERVLADGYQVIEVTMPALITVSNELGEARYATLKGIMAAAKKQPVIWKPADIGVEPGQIGAAGRKNKLLKLFQPVKEGKCELIEADSPAEAGVKLAQRLREAKLF